MSSSVSCPKCGGPVKLPANSLPTDEVQCPACKAAFEVMDAAEAGAPDLKIASGSSDQGPADVIPMKADDDFDIDDLQEIPFDPDLGAKKDDFEFETMAKPSHADGVADDPLDDMLEEALFEDDKGGKPNVGEQFIEEASHASDAADEEEAIVDLTEDDLPHAELAHDAGDAMSAAFEPMEPHAESSAHAESGEDEPWDLGKEAAMPQPAKSADDEPWNLAPAPTEPKHVTPPPVELAGKAKKEKVKKEKGPKKPKSMVIEIAKILVGGIVGLVAAYAILIFALKKDPFGLAPMLPQSIVPAELKPQQIARAPMPMQQQPDENPTPDAGTPDAAATPDAATPPDAGTPANPTDPLATPPGLAATPDAGATPPAAIDPLNPTATPTPPAADATATLDPNGGNRVPSLPEPGAASTLPPANNTAGNDPLTNALAAPPAATANPLDATPPAAAAPDPFATPAPTTTAFPPIPEPAPVVPKEPRGIKAENFSTLADAQQAMTALESSADALYNAPGGAQNPDIKKLRGGFYVALAKLAETLAMIAPQDDDKVHLLSTAAAERIAEKLTDAFRVGELSQLGGFWLNAPRRTNNGAVLVGTVQVVQPQGKLFKTLVKLADTTAADGRVQEGMIVPVITADDPQLNPNDSALVLGAIVKDPILNLNQYEGVDPMVVWAANVRRLPSMQQ